MAEGTLLRDRHDMRQTTVAAGTQGEVRQMRDGRAAVLQGLNVPAAGDQCAWRTEGQVVVPKTASIVILDGGRVYWDHSTNKAHFKRVAGTRDFYLGTAVGDAASAATTMTVNLNVRPRYEIELGQGEWTKAVTDGLGVEPLTAGATPVKLEFDNTSEVAMAAIYSVQTVDVDSNPILEMIVARGAAVAAALDISIGLANETHGTDFDTVAESCIIHMDGDSLDILAESDDGSTEVAATNTTKDAVSLTDFEVWIDCRNLADIQIYIDAVLVLPATTFKLDAATGPLMAIAHIEKTSDTSLADVRVKLLQVRTAEQ